MDIITIYYRENSEASFQAIRWLENHNFLLDKKRIETITHQDLFRLIYLSELDVPDILTKGNKYSISYHIKMKGLRKLRFGESLKFLVQHPELLEVPIILSEVCALSGYEKQKMETFLGGG